MRNTFLSDEGSWKNPSIAALASRLRQKHHTVRMLHSTAPVPQGDILFILGFFQIVKPAHRYGVRRTVLL